MLNKNDILDVEILDNGMNFEGIARQDNIIIFVPGAIKGEKVRIVLIKVNKNFAIGKITDFILKSKYRCESVCPAYKLCGGCQGHHMDYNFQLEIKRNNVVSLLKKQGLNDIKVDKVIGMGLPYFYRNKVQYPVRNIKGINKIGFYSINSHTIVENKGCFIQNRVIDLLSKVIFENLISLGFSCYNDETKDGDIKHIIVKRGYHTSEIMVVIVVSKSILLNDSRFNKLNELLVKNNVKSFSINLNDKDTNKILGDKTVCIYGDGYIKDTIGDYSFYISSKSFFQVNTVQVEVLYNVLKENLNLSKSDILFDLYSGVGTIGIFLSDSVKNVYGIEIEKEAVNMANKNILYNNIDNCEYIAGPAEDKIEEFKIRGISPDVIVVDPPRKGLDEKCIDYILSLKPKKVGYISCNPATLVRDIKMLSSSYMADKIVPVDMFSYTPHIECVCALTLKKC